MPVRLSSKGQLVIPSEVRKSLGLKPGDRFDVRLENDEIILTPVNQSSALARLYGKYRQSELLNALQTEHQEELTSQNTIPSPNYEGLGLVGGQ